MQILIDIDEEVYDFIKRTGYHTQSLYEAIKNGTPLPKGHGRLIDISEYEKYFNTEITYDDGNHIHSVYTGMISTIIEADRAESEE